MSYLDILTSVGLIILSSILLYIFGTVKFGYWKKKGVEEMNPYPFIGDNHSIIKPKNPIKELQRYYNYFKGKRFGGIYFFQQPQLLVQDPEILKQILLKDAEHFMNRNNWLELGDPVINKSLFFLKDDEWKAFRSILTTVFTSSKLKEMFLFAEKCAQRATEHAESKISQQLKSEGDVLSMDFKDFFSRYGADLIATTAFGFELNSYQNPDNKFLKAGAGISNFGLGFNILRILFIIKFPTLAKKLNIYVLGKEINDYFISIVSESIKNREMNNIVRKDVIHFLMEARKPKERKDNDESGKENPIDLTNEHITSLSTIFFLAGFEAVSHVLSYVCYELALNSDFQEKLHQEIDKIIEKEKGITYDGVMQQAKYLDMVINETLRKWPPSPVTDREVSKTYVFPKTDTSPEVVLNKGDVIFIPIAAIHRDPDYFPEPDKFDPERFRDEESMIKPFTFLPFGAGLRHCIGMRFALMEAKTCLFYLLNKFEVVPTGKTTIPIKLLNNSLFIIKPEKGFWLGLKLRNKKIEMPAGVQ